MNRSIAPDEIAPLFREMTPFQKRNFLAAYAHELTIVARMHFADEEYELARQCNESLHRLTGYLASSSSRSPEAEVETDSSFIEMMVQGANHRGWTDILIRSLLYSRAKRSPVT
jgi:hypothetical protein